MEVNKTDQVLILIQMFKLSYSFFRSECDELRTFFSKQLQAGMKDEHMKQIEDKIAQEKKRLVNTYLFSSKFYPEDIDFKN